MAASPDQAEQDRRNAAVLSKHLDPDYTGEFEGPSPGRSGLASSSSYFDSAAPESSLKLQGGDVHRDLYRIEARSRRARLEQRAATFSFPGRSPSLGPVWSEDGGRGGGGGGGGGGGDDDDAASGKVVNNEPGGFRRNYLQRQMLHRRVQSMTVPVTRNFVDFLDLYGAFAGEDLQDSDDDEEAVDGDEVYEEEGEEPQGERRPLLGRRTTSRKSFAEKGDAGNLKSFFTLLKAFVGTGIMFLPRAFRNGGILFSSVTMIVVSLVTALCFHLLLQCRRRYGGGYGELGEAIGGPKFRALILFSIAISQIGFVCAGIIFTAENLHAFLRAVTPSDGAPIPNKILILGQLVMLIPLSFIRNISKLGPAALLADACILFGLTYIYYYDIASIASRPGFAPSVQLFNPADYTLTIGSAIFTFEGIGLILPIQSSMRKPEQFSFLLYTVMFIITIVFTSVGFLSYATFGDDTKTEIITNFPQSSKLVNAVQFLYSIAVLVGTPVQLFPAIRIMEGKLFGRRSGKRSVRTKWKKNLFRTGVVLACGAISVLGQGDLDKFVSLIGSFACIPLVYIYPAYLHHQGIATSRWVKWGDVVMIVLGIACCVYTTFITVSIWIKS